MKSSVSGASSSRSRNLIGVLSFLKPYRAATTLAVSMLLVNIGLEMTLPRVSGTAINQMHHAIDTDTAYNPWKMAGLFIALALVRAGMGFTMGRLRNRLVQGTLKDLRSAYFDAVQRLSFAFHDKTNTGELISRGTSDINRLQEFLFACLFLGIDISVAMVMTLILITWISPICGLVTVITLVSTVGLIIYCARQLHSHWRMICMRK
jgi:ABC-type multidrug transport system fused ATPase/permease subunit